MDLNQSPQRGASFEQDLLWSVLDQDAVLDILAMAHDAWQIDPGDAWRALQDQAARGRLRAYHSVQPSRDVNLAAATFNDVTQDFTLFVEPTDATRTRLTEL